MASSRRLSTASSSMRRVAASDLSWCAASSTRVEPSTRSRRRFLVGMSTSHRLRGVVGPAALFLFLEFLVLEYDTQRDIPQLKFCICVVLLKSAVHFFSTYPVRQIRIFCVLTLNFNPTHRSSWGGDASSKMCDSACCD